MRITYRETVLLVLCVAALLVVWVSGYPKSTHTPVQRDLAAEEARWGARIAAVGGVAAYTELAREVEPETPQERHAQAHYFGGALYDTEGVESVSVCDAQFSYGCFHEFLGRAIAENGLPSVADLNQKCFDRLDEQGLACQHGIGHGLVSYLGYDQKDLVRALEVCRDLPHGDPIGGCFGGVFMEFNMRTLASENGLRPGFAEDPTEPCSALRSPYQQPCLYWQPQWWYQSQHEAGVGVQDAFFRIGELCRSFNDASLLRACFEGTGNIVPPSVEFSEKRSAEVCDYMAQTPTERTYCRAVAANSFFNGGAGKRGDSLVVCAGLEGPYHEYCVAYAENRFNVLIPGILP